jgi:serine protease Do
VVLGFNGRPVGDSGELAAMVGESTPGAKVQLEVLRKGERRTLTATLGTAADPSAPRAAADETADKGRLGLAVRPLSPQEQEAAKVSGGLLVQGVNGPAARAGVAPGDIVLEAGGRPVKSVEDLRAATHSAKTIALLVQRGERRLFVPLQVG